MYLRAEMKIGRDADNDLCIPRSSVSGRHAALRWTSGRWTLRDTSTHGTVVNQKLVKGAAHLLSQGDELTFVESDEVWALVDAAPPGLVLRPLDPSLPEIYVDVEEGLLGLPSAERPEQTIFHVGGFWFLERQGATRERLVDQSTVDLLGVAYKVHGAALRQGTMEPENPLTLFDFDAAEMTITVLRGEDEAELVLRAGGISKRIKANRPLYVLAYLAERRIRDHTSWPASDEGWVSVDLACTELGVDRSALNVDVFRVREAARRTGILNAANIIERRGSQLRLGMPAERCTVRRD